MSLLGFALVLSAAVCHATWNFFVKRIAAGPELVWLFSVLSVLLYFPAAVYVSAGQAAFSPLAMAFIAGSAALHLGYFLLLQRGYRRGDLSLVYPTARATGPLVSVGFALAFLGEDLTLRIAAGGILIVFGVLMLTGGIRLGRPHALPSLGFGLAAGLLIGSYTVWDAYAVAVLAVPPLLLDYASSVGRSVLLAPLAYRRRGRVRRLWRAHRLGVLAIAVFNPLAYILVLIALTFTPVVYVAPIRELSVSLTVLMGSLLLGEGELRRRLVWATVIVGGVAVLATSP
ncbi:hypothetical protein AY599_09980 [Leptolyngbya valderiana BDU 20041]|nr:hypothetical protein AY599_09980 [Leptolyngbya valderiana BDU 20041]